LDRYTPGPQARRRTDRGEADSPAISTQQDISGTYPNGSATTAFDLTPTQDYSCSTATGSLNWNALTKTLSVRGVMYLDGSAAITNGAVNEYNGMATLYISGSLYVNGMMCGKRNANLSDCDFTAGTRIPRCSSSAHTERMRTATPSC
jgi:hypothetical protein